MSGRNDLFARVGRQVRAVAVAIVLAPVHLWRMTIVFRQPRCRYYPSCSTYAVGALRVHGPLRGTRLAVGRVLRCHPWSPGGIDHVPDAIAPAATPSAAIKSSGARDA